MAIPQNSRRDSLMIFRNNMMLEIAITEVNLKMAEKDRFATADLNPGLSTHITAFIEKIKQINKNIEMVDKMLEGESKKVN